MSWETKTDYCGCAIANKLSAKSATENRAGQYLEKLAADGHIAATKPYGTENATPSVEYILLDDVTLTDGELELGTVTTIDSKKYALSGISISTGAGQEPTFSANAVQVESTATTGRTYKVPALTLSKDEIAQILFGAFTLTGASCELSQVTANVSCTIGLHTANGDPKASSIHSGHVVVNATIGQYGSTVPTVAAATGWDISSPLTCSDPDADMPSWTVSLSKPLELVAASASS